jgi:hypothetical protein
MNDFLNALKADLLERRMLAALLALGVALLGALGYAVIGGGTGNATAPLASSPSARTPGIAVSQAVTNSNKPVAETTNGSALQRAGNSRDPFAALRGASTTATAAKTAAASKPSSSSTPSASTKSESGSSSKKTASAPSAPAEPSTPRKPATVYRAAVLFGGVPAGAVPKTAPLTAYENLKLLTPLPSSKLALLVFRGVTTDGKRATFTLVEPTILHGEARCLPSESQCQAITIKPGQYEQLEYLSPLGQLTTYELRLVSIDAAKASAAALKKAHASQSKAGLELLRAAGLMALPGLRYSPSSGALDFAPTRAAGARAHTAVR